MQDMKSLMTKKAFQTFLACLWSFTWRWIRVRVRLGTGLGFGARQSRTRLLILWITVCYFFLRPWPRVWIWVWWSLLHYNRRKDLKKNNPWKAAKCMVTKLMDHLLLPSPSGFLCPSPSRFLLWREILLTKVFSLGSNTSEAVRVRGSTWSLFLPESESDGVGSDSDGDPLSASRSLEEPPRTFFGAGGRWNEEEEKSRQQFLGSLFISNQGLGPQKLTWLLQHLMQIIYMTLFFKLPNVKFQLITKKLKKRLLYFCNFINLKSLSRRHLPWLALASSLLLRPFPGPHSLSPNCPRCPSQLFESLLLLPHRHLHHSLLRLLPLLCHHCCRPRCRMSWLAARQQWKDWHRSLTWGKCLMTRCQDPLRCLLCHNKMWLQLSDRLY